jgi:hypothetical protein
MMSNEPIYTIKLKRAQAYTAVNALQSVINEMQEQMAEQDQAQAQNVEQPKSEKKPEAQS